ncbi:sensor histidine kinase [Georgenia thermotolerans]|uniref:histidine kinase n=1 Tax=Georgenia thermotolerans TaxID=527326 RepID=A0A7J5UV59_9MICO|nr:histidine kinase [Georgenia thermotolerans]KAE8766153.1 hypothetical protein GB883_00515 [Georgenia thermotolerans]
MRTRARWREAIVLVALSAGTVVVVLAVLGGSPLTEGPVLLPIAAFAGALVGLWCRPAPGAAGAAVAAVGLAAANQIVAPQEYAPLDDLVFFAAVVGGPALAGAVVAGRRTQVRRLRELSEQRLAQRAAEVRAARLEEQNRVETLVQHDIIQRMGAIALQAAGGLSHPAGSPAAGFAAIETTAREALDELRAAVGVLRAPADLAPGAEAPLPRRAPSPIGRTDVLVGLWGVAMAVEGVAVASSRGPVRLNAACCLALGALLVVRRRRPVTTAAAGMALAVLMEVALTPPTVMVTTIVWLLLLGFAVGAHATGARRLAGAAVLVLGTVLMVGVPTAGAVAAATVICGLVVGSGAVAATWSARADALDRLLQQVERGREAEVRLAVAEYRQSIARSLHDSVAHAMTVVCLHASAAQRLGDDADRAAQSLTTIAEAARAGMAELRRGLDSLDAPAGLSLPAVVDDARRLGVEVTLVTAPGGPPLPPETEALLARAMREGLVNVARHAPGSPARVELSAVGDRVQVEVVDHGGAAPSAPRIAGTGTGLAGLTEAFAARGGAVHAGPDPDGGFRLRVSLPLPAVVVA